MTDAHTNDGGKRRRPPKRDGWMISDAELIEKLGVPEKTARAAIALLDADRNSGFPPKQKLWGDRRHRVSVEKWLEATGGLKLAPSRRDSE